MSTFEDINGQLAFVKAKSKTEALSLKDEAKDIVQGGKSVVIFFNKRYNLYLAPGHDPYQIRRDIENFLNPPKTPPKETPDTKPEITGKSKNSPVRDSSGKFVSNSRKLSPKKSFWESLR